MPDRRRFVAALVALVLLLAAPPAAAHSGDDRRAELEGLIDSASAQEAQALAELGEVRTRRRALDAEVTRLDREIASAHDALVAAVAEADRLGALTVDLEARLDDTARELRAARRRFDAAVTQMYMTGSGAGRALGYLVVEGSGPLEIGAGTRYLEGISGERRRAVDDLGEVRDAIEELRAEADRRRADALEAQRLAQQRRDEIAALRGEQDRTRAAVRAEEAREEALVASVQSQLREYERELDALQTTSRATSGFLAEIQRGQTRAATFRSARPVPGGVTSGFGMRVHPILRTSRLHAGVDFAGAYGSTVRAGAAGTVVWAGPRGGYGNAVIIDHGGQWATLYAHLSSTRVATGERVAAGAAIGALGSSGLATGPHLHFEVRLLGVPQDPLGHL